MRFWRPARGNEEREDAALGVAPFPVRDEAIGDAEARADLGVAVAVSREQNASRPSSRTRRGRRSRGTMHPKPSGSVALKWSCIAE
jgi:hypothetical protein